MSVLDTVAGYLPNASPKIFLIGFNRCGTKSFHHLFKANGIKSIHCGGGARSSNIACTISRRLWTPNPLGRFCYYNAIGDMIYVSSTCHIEGNAFFRELDHRYKRSYFIFNDRNLDDWIRSRYKFKGGHFAERQSKYLRVSVENLGEKWAEIYESHKAEVERYFSGRSVLLHFHITKDDPARISQFLSPDFEVDASHWRHVGKSAAT